MSHPPQKQPLQLLYPGRYMHANYEASGSNIPNSNPEGLKATQLDLEEKAAIAKLEEEILVRRLGGQPKTIETGFIQPTSLAEDRFR